MSFLGYPATTGAEFIDYFLTDVVASPPEMASAYTEKFAYLPETFYPFNNLQGISERIPPRKELGITEKPKQFVFANFNRNLKIKPETFHLWCDLLRSRPSSTLWLRRFHKRVQENLLRAAEKKGVMNGTLVFAGRLPNRSDHLARHRQIDLYLDTPRFGGHSTLADVLWTGVPSIVLPEEGLASRIGSSMMLALNATPFVVRNMQDYSTVSLALAGHQKSNRLKNW
eukprot:CAMPEP_0184293402 /NCGR_PEP_ID=MMETSP1049-20130417/4838_1 /TAXON_ID=77928 /ORGANISM="Proteomonas sulcata, Strain CCMP704" /LENGTH=226 /DNA_ID=CAMNT_0026601369 /DNA_START=261 /DNA_END=938 /DNA_ORIENTATION=-